MTRVIRSIDPKAISIGIQGIWIGLLGVWSVLVKFLPVVVLRFFVVLELLNVALFEIGLSFDDVVSAFDVVFVDGVLFEVKFFDESFVLFDTAELSDNLEVLLLSYYFALCNDKRWFLIFLMRLKCLIRW